MPVLGYIITAIVAYLLGSIPTGFLVARAKGIDIRTVGSGNIGATNVFRALGKAAGVFVLAVDAAKGYVACQLVGYIGKTIFGGSVDAASLENFSIIAGFAAILGHNYTCWLHFKGGKGIATSAGVLLALFPVAFLLVLGIWLVVLAISRYVSLASIAAAFWLPILVFLLGYSGRLLLVAAFMGALAIYKHKANIQRLMQGTENRLGDKTPAPADGATPGATK